MIVISIGIVLLALTGSYLLRHDKKVNRDLVVQSGGSFRPLLSGAASTRAQPHPVAKARRRARKKARRANRKQKPSVRSRRRKRGTGAKRKHGRARGR